jgi:hypothetical protein
LASQTAGTSRSASQGVGTTGASHRADGLVGTLVTLGAGSTGCCATQTVASSRTHYWPRTEKNRNTVCFSNNALSIKTKP